MSQKYSVDIAGEISEVTVLDYSRKLAVLFQDKSFDKVIGFLQKYYAI